MAKYVRETPWPFPEHPAWGKAIILDPAEGRVILDPPRTKVAIVGFADSSRDLAPFDDPAWEIWGLNQLARYIPRAERWWEIHHRSQFEADIARGTDYVGWLKVAPVPIYMQALESEFPSAVRYPLERIVAAFGREYLTSTPAYMMALAIMEGFRTIGVYGIDLIIGREYEFEKPCMEYWIGRAEALGIEVILPSVSALCKQGVRYGVPTVIGTAPTPAQIQRLLSEVMAKRNEALTVLNNCDGAAQALQSILEMHTILERGGSIPGS
jgi:hypothetical protein